MLLHITLHFYLTATVIKSFEKNQFFDCCVTKARFFPTLHDAVLFAVEPALLQEIASMNPTSALPEAFVDVHLENDNVFDARLENEEVFDEKPQLIY